MLRRFESGRRAIDARAGVRLGLRQRPITARYRNTTALTSVTGELLDPLQYSCKLNAVSARNLSSVDTWTFAYASAPKDVTTPAGAPLPLLVSQVDTDPFQNCLGRGHIQAKIAEFWGAAAVETVDFVEMGHVHAEGWDAKVVPPLAAWLDKA